MGRLNQGYEPPPRSAGQWIQHFTKSLLIDVPRREAGFASIEAANIAISQPGTRGDPDLLVTLKSGKAFYIKLFIEQREFFPLDLPTLYFPIGRGPVGAFWILEDEYALKQIYRW